MALVVLREGEMVVVLHPMIGASVLGVLPGVLGEGVSRYSTVVEAFDPGVAGEPSVLGVHVPGVVGIVEVPEEIAILFSTVKVCRTHFTSDHLSCTICGSKLRKRFEPLHFTPLRGIFCMGGGGLYTKHFVVWG